MGILLTSDSKPDIACMVKPRLGFRSLTMPPNAALQCIRLALYELAGSSKFGAKDRPYSQSQAHYIQLRLHDVHMVLQDLPSVKSPYETGQVCGGTR